MTGPTPYRIVLYGAEHGDVGIPDVFSPPPLEAAKKMAADRLGAHLNDERLGPGQKPWRADIIDEDTKKLAASFKGDISGDVAEVPVPGDANA